MKRPGEPTEPGESAKNRRSFFPGTKLTPVRLVSLGFAVAVALGTGLLLIPWATQPGSTTSPIEALFTSTSAICVTGLVVLDTPIHWSGLGQGIILALIQIGGLGIMTMASLVGLILADRIGLRSRLNTAAEMRPTSLGDIRSVVGGVVRISLSIEAVTAICLGLRFWLGYDEPPLRAVWLGVFHSISAFNNAGFVLFEGSFISFATDPWICLPLMIAVVLGGLGFPVLFEIIRQVRRRPSPLARRWSLHARLTLSVTGVLLIIGPALVLVFEWSRTLASFGVAEKVLVGSFQGVMSRSAGLSSVDYAELDQATLLVTDILMFIGGGSGGTAGGIKVTTFAVLLFVIIAEMRGDRSVTAFDRRLDTRVQRQALTVALFGIALVMVPTVVLLAGTSFELDELLFEVVSAFATVGLSTGITSQLPEWGQLILIVLMYLGRIGSITLVSALAARDRGRRYTFPEERPFIG